MTLDEALEFAKEGVDELKAAIHECGGEMSERQFDAKFNDSSMPLKFPEWILNGGIIWGDMSWSIWSCYLHLLKNMMAAGIVIAETRDGLVYYRLRANPPRCEAHLAA